MKTTFALLICLFCSSLCVAQTGSGFKGIRVTMDEVAQRAIASRNEYFSLPGFRVCIYTGNDQYARGMASSASAHFTSLYGGVPVHTRYDSPVWKVLCGACLTRTEATRLLGQLRGFFPAAFIVNDRLSKDEVMAMPSSLKPVTTTTEDDSAVAL
ncbi:MAG: hypothetical protein RSC07_03375 [Mucinivorans sp.]